MSPVPADLASHGERLATLTVQVEVVHQKLEMLVGTINAHIEVSRNHRAALSDRVAKLEHDVHDIKHVLQQFETVGHKVESWEERARTVSWIMAGLGTLLGAGLVLFRDWLFPPKI